MANPTILAELPKYTREAVRFYWQTHSQQLEKQRKAGGSDQGLRSAVTGCAQMDDFIELLTSEMPPLHRYAAPDTLKP